MRKVYLIALCLVMVTCACKSEPVIPDNPPVEDKTGPGLYTFVLPDHSEKQSWEAGDQILVHGGYLPEAITLTLTAANISADGRTAEVNIDPVPGDQYPPDSFYAAYPASMLDMEFSSWCYDIFHFKQASPLLMCAWLSDGKQFKFQNVCASITCRIDGDWDSCTFAGQKWEEVSCTEFEIEINSDVQNWHKLALDTDYYLKSSISNGRATFLIPGGITLSEGFSIYLCKDSEYSKVYINSEAVSLDNSSRIDLGNITSSLQDYNGPRPESPVMPVIKGSSSFVVNVPEISGLCFTADGSALWAVGDNGCLAQVTFDGQSTKFFSRSADMEGITIHPETGDLYIALEDGSQAVARVRAPEYKAEDYEVLFKVQDAKNFSNSGLEGITYYKDNSLYIGSQEGAYLFRYTLDGEMLSKISLKRIARGIKEVGGLYYDPVTDWLWVSDSVTHKLYVFDGEATHLLASYPVSYIGNNESVCVDHERSCVWVGNDEDTPKIFKIEFEGL